MSYPGKESMAVSRYLKPLFCLAKLCLVTLSMLVILPAAGFCSWEDLNVILTEAFGQDVARECNDYYQGLEINEQGLNSIRDAVARLVEAGYPEGCPKEYLKTAADLSRAGIDLEDLTNKIREGIAKKVGPDRLNRVIAQRGEALQDARATVLKLEGGGVEFLDRQMAYRVVADYLLRGVSEEEMRTGLAERDLRKYPALENVIR